MHFLVIALCAFISTNLLAGNLEFGDFKDCGEYNVAGVFKVNDKESRFDYVVYGGSQSEIKIKLKMTDEPKAAPYINRPTLVRARFNKLIEKQVGEFEILEIQSRISNPLNGANDSGFNLIKANKCL